MKDKKELGESLIQAAKAGDMEQVRDLVESGADPNYSWIPPFMWAYFEGHHDISKYLIEQGGNVNHDVFSEGVLLSFAARDGEFKFCEYLIDVAGAEVNHGMPKGGETPLHNAAEANQLGGVELLIDRGAEVNRRAKKGESELEFGYMDGETPLHIAAVFGSIELIQYLLDHGADKTMHNYSGMSPHDFAIKHKRPEDVRNLLDFEDDANDNEQTHSLSNDEIAQKLMELHTILIVADYPEDHAARYPRLAYTISRMEESVAELASQGKLQEAIPGVGDIVSTIITEYVETGTCSKLQEYASDVPETIVELIPIPGLGPKTIKLLYHEVGVDSLSSLRNAIDEDKLKGIKGIGKKTIEKFEDYLEEKL
ncbi:hypothetical protein F4212_03315 [Candidatus Poribacteria bacterium]|nr:hypothetical protein [Candidatus Poribacteria bacterium]